jgi:3-oxoacyl-[acyl-carrier protein] reductase
VVTGAAKGLGRAYSLALAAEGAKVVIADLDLEGARGTAEEVRATGGEALALHSDVTREDNTQAMAEATLSAYGRLDALVNNAGIYPLRPFEETSLEEWDRVLAVNLTGAFLCARAVTPAMRAQGKGKIVNISSATVFRPIPSLAHYIASKMGIIGLTRALAVELGPYNICVNAVAPGLTRAADIPGVQPTEVVERIISQQSFRRMERPADLVGTILFLVSDQSDFITGQTISVDGGWTTH